MRRCGISLDCRRWVVSQLPGNVDMEVDAAGEDARATSDV
jgi:hypothetical protein